MYIHSTTGTINYLDTIFKEHDNLYFQANGENAVLYYEDSNNESMFKTKRSYKVINSMGELNDKLPLAVYHIPAYGTGKSTIISHLSDFAEKLKQARGLNAFRISQNIDGENYLVLLSFVELSAYHDFKDSDTFKNYLTMDVLKQFQNIEAMFQDYISTKLYFSLHEYREQMNELEDNY
ncbi:hypothetical protein [Phocicoccus pinnipedialis]|uniref:Signal transduction protein TRAP n=1 Tax=Phocicoccus pinnipedialis TaxID=110845 RepID=A0A6V7RM83_9BACL|nr:hypothetical protein [Jeotgalicoccus pinnipedialis]MBP1939592.1 hypothetical protein [Jeotgalicoccus pinnipedialis]CAD2079076.1 Signal transduction protein TRAP [Jeotgalicoccus pinnipedialis]